MIISTKSKEQQQRSNIYTFCCTASKLLCLTSEAGVGGSQLPRMLYLFEQVYIMKYITHTVFRMLHDVPKACSSVHYNLICILGLTAIA